MSKKKRCLNTKSFLQNCKMLDEGPTVSLQKLNTSIINENAKYWKRSNSGFEKWMLKTLMTSVFYVSVFTNLSDKVDSKPDRDGK